ncbi:hypothetical protein AJ88_31605 [Mesorhizobium amorphae CCBAU 01583]|nr:hypothetical protein AJ88_31605 [Mesorhizobium amorphae CCBAU 01583]
MPSLSVHSPMSKRLSAGRPPLKELDMSACEARSTLMQYCPSSLRGTLIDELRLTQARIDIGAKLSGVTDVTVMPYR